MCTSTELAGAQFGRDGAVAGVAWLGYPTTDETGCPDGVGRFNHFERDSIYWTLEFGAHEVHGDIRAKWAEMGWETSYLGYPISDELNMTGGRVSRFQHGEIRWTPGGGAVPNHAQPID